MVLAEFLKKYREGVEAATGTPLSVNAVAKLLDVKSDTLDKWERRGNLPRSKNDRIKLKVFFGIDNFQNIFDKTLHDAIKRYPKGLGIMENNEDDPIQNNSDNSNSRKAQNKEQKSEVLTDNNDIPSGTKTEEVEDMTTTLMLMHKETIEVMRSLSRSFEDVAKANLIQAQMLRQRFGIDENESEEQSFKKAV